jgi:hypothetical protein
MFFWRRTVHRPKLMGVSGFVTWHNHHDPPGYICMYMYIPSVPNVYSRVVVKTEPGLKRAVQTLRDKIQRCDDGRLGMVALSGMYTRFNCSALWVRRVVALVMVALVVPIRAIQEGREWCVDVTLVVVLYQGGTFS